MSLMREQAMQPTATEASTARHALRISDVGPGICNKHVAIRHPDCGKRPGIERRVCRQQAVETEDVGGDRIDVIVAQRLRCVLRHGATDVIEQGRRVWPIAADGTHRLWRCKRALPADEPVANAALAPCAVTGRALLVKYLVSMAAAAASRRQAAAVAADIEVPTRDLRRRRGTAN